MHDEFEGAGWQVSAHPHAAADRGDQRLGIGAADLPAHPRNKVTDCFAGVGPKILTGAASTFGNRASVGGLACGEGVVALG